MPSRRVRLGDPDWVFFLAMVSLALPLVGVPQGLAFALSMMAIMAAMMRAYWPAGERRGALYWIAVAGVSAVALMLFHVA